MKIAIISTYFGSELGGANVSTRLFIENLPPEYDINIITISKNPDNTENETKTFSLSFLRYLPSQAFFFDFSLFYWLISKQIQKKLEQIKPQIVHIQDLELLVPAMMAAKRLGLQTIATVRDHRFVCNLLACMQEGKIEFHSSKQYLDCLCKTSRQLLGSSLLGYLLYPFLRSKPFTLRKYLKEADHIVSVSDFVKRNLAKAGINQEKITTIYNCTPELANKLKINAPDNTPNKIRIFSAGQLVQFKGFADLVNALRKVADSCNNIELIIAGDGADKTVLEKLSEKLGLTNIINFVGKVPYTEMQNYYSSADIIVLPSIIPEALSRVVWEAFATGRPLIATAVGGNPEFVKDHETGLLAQPKDADALAEKIIELIGNKSLRIKLATNALELIKTHNAKQIKKYTLLYNTLYKIVKNQLK